MNKRIFLGVIFITVLFIALLSISSCVDSKNNPVIPTYNSYPRLAAITFYPTTVCSSGTTSITVTAKDDDAGDKLSVTFREEQNRGSFQVTSPTTAIYTAPLVTGSLRVYAKVTDESGASVEGFKTLEVVNYAPEIFDVTASPATINYNVANTSKITIVVVDKDVPNGVTTSCVMKDTSTATGTLTLLSSVTIANTTTAVWLYTQTSAPGFYNAQFDITATDNLGNTGADTLSIGSGLF